MTTHSLVIEAEAPVGTSLDDACINAIRLATELRAIINLKFNDTPVPIHPTDTLQSVTRRWKLQRKVEEAARERPKPCFCPGCGKQVAVIDLEKGKTFGRQKWICCDEDGNRVHVWLVEYTAESFTLERGDPNE